MKKQLTKTILMLSLLLNLSNIPAHAGEGGIYDPNGFHRWLPKLQRETALNSIDDIVTASDGSMYILSFEGLILGGLIKHVTNEGILIREWFLSDQEDQKFCGTAEHLAIDSNDNIYVGFNNYYNNLEECHAFNIRKYGRAGALLETWRTSGDAELHGIDDMVIDSKDNLIVENTTRVNNQSITSIKKFDLLHNLIGRWDLDTEGNIAVDSHDDIFVADMNHIIHQYDEDGSLKRIWTIPRDTRYVLTFHIAIDENDKIYLASTIDDITLLQKFDKFGNYLKFWETEGEGKINYVHAFTANKNSQLYIAGHTHLKKFDTDGAFLDTLGSGGGEAGELHMPSEITIDTINNMYVLSVDTDTYAFKIQKFDRRGHYQPLWLEKTYERSPAIATDSQNNLYVLEKGSSNILKYNSDGDLLLQWNSNSYYARSLAIDKDDNIYVGDYVGEVKKFDAQGIENKTWFVDIEDDSIDAIAFDEQGYIYISSYKSTHTGLEKISVYDQSANYVKDILLEESNNTFPFIGISSIVIGTQNNMYVNLAGIITEYTLSGKLKKSWYTPGSRDGEYILANRLTTDTKGDLYITDTVNNRIQKKKVHRNSTLTNILIYLLF